MFRFIAVMALGLLSAGSWVHAAPGAGERFKKYANKYPFDLFEGEPDVTRRLRTLLAANYDFFMERMQTQTPFDSVQGILVAKACKAHECTLEEAILLIDVSDGTIHCAVHSGRYGGKVRTFSEDPDHFPEGALRYMLAQ